MLMPSYWDKVLHVAMKKHLLFIFRIGLVSQFLQMGAVATTFTFLQEAIRKYDNAPNAETKAALQRAQTKARICYLVIFALPVTTVIIITIRAISRKKGG
jgi:hypothetical protein